MLKVSKGNIRKKVIINNTLLNNLINALKIYKYRDRCDGILG